MILPISDKNIEECVGVYIKAYNCAPWNYHWSLERARQYLQEYLASGTFAGFALYERSNMVAAIFGHTKTWWTDEQLIIDEFFVSNENQGKGYGKQLLAYCESYAAEHQIGSIVLMTNKYMPSFKFYNKNDYIPTEQFVFMFKQIESR